MKRILFAFTLILGTLSLPAIGQAQTAADFDRKTYDITHTLAAKKMAWAQQLRSAQQSKDFASLKPLRMDIEKYITAQLTELKTMSDVGNSGQLRLAMINYLLHEKSMETKTYMPMELMDKTTPQDKIDAAQIKFTEVSGLEIAEIKKVNDAREAYGKANGFTIKK